MCTWFGADVILANLLVNDREDTGISMRDINNYCNALKTEIFKSPDQGIDKCVYIDINSQSINEVLMKYNSKFRFSECRERFYKNTVDDKIDIDIYNGQYSISIKKILKDTAKKVLTLSS
jgi:hypothetical protein